MDKKQLNAAKLKPFRKEVQSLITFKLPLWQGVILSFLLIAFAVKLQFILQPKVGTIVFIAMYPVIFFMGWIGGTFVGFLTLFLSVAASLYFFIFPYVETGYIDTPNLIRLCMFIFSNSLVILIIYRLRKAEEKATALFNKVAESDTQYRAIVELSPHIIWYSDAVGQTTYLNQTWEEYTGVKSEDALGVWNHQVHPDDLPYVSEIWSNCIATLNKFEVHMRIKRYDGEYRWFFARGKAIINPQGQLVQWIGKAVDFHDQKLAIDSKNEFISLASHELKTPLTSLSLQLQILEKNVKNKNEAILNFESLEKLSKISLAQINQINHLIEDMLGVTRIGGGTITYEIVESDLNQIIENATQIVAGHFLDAKIPLTVVAKEIILVPADQRKLAQVLVNLLINALKYGNGTPVSIEISKNEMKQVAIIEVVDSGFGISKENQHKIFDRFVQINTYGKNAGLGLGLYLSKEIVSAHSGLIFVESEAGKGARFVIELPL